MATVIGGSAFGISSDFSGFSIRYTGVSKRTSSEFSGSGVLDGPTIPPTVVRFTVRGSNIRYGDEGDGTLEPVDGRIGEIIVTKGNQRVGSVRFPTSQRPSVREQEEIFPFSPVVFRFNDSITGTRFNDRLFGYGGNDRLRGGAGSDTLVGGNGSDGLVGGAGSDRLTGGAGADRFVFNSRNERRDVITDFTPVSDTIVVSARGFGGGLIAGAPIAASQFRLGTRAADRSDRFIYNRANGSLFFDADGSGGAFGQIEIADLASNLAMTRSDIFVVA